MQTNFITFHFLNFNRGVHRKEPKGCCYTWKEVEAKRGRNEVSSCFHHFLMTHNLLIGENNSTLWSDRCAGQNKNKMVLADLPSATSMRLASSNITNKYVGTGHSHMVCGSMHGHIESPLLLKKILRTIRLVIYKFSITSYFE